MRESGCIASPFLALIMYRSEWSALCPDRVNAQKNRFLCPLYSPRAGLYTVEQTRNLLFRGIEPRSFILYPLPMPTEISLFLILSRIMTINFLDNYLTAFIFNDLRENVIPT
jgi:hypothetical protein